MESACEIWAGMELFWQVQGCWRIVTSYRLVSLVMKWGLVGLSMVSDSELVFCRFQFCTLDVAVGATGITCESPWTGAGAQRRSSRPTSALVFTSNLSVGLHVQLQRCLHVQLQRCLRVQPQRWSSRPTSALSSRPTSALVFTSNFTVVLHVQPQRWSSRPTSALVFTSNLSVVFTSNLSVGLHVQPQRWRKCVRVSVGRKGRWRTVHCVFVCPLQRECGVQRE